MYRRCGVNMGGYRPLSIAMITFLNQTERQQMAKKFPNSAAAKVRAFARKNPTLRAPAIAEATGVNIKTVYYAMSTMRRKKPTKLIDLSAAGSPLYQKTRMATSADYAKPDLVNSPPHYTAGGMETIDFIEAKKLNYNLGNAVKYITRADLKGSRIQDLQKAKWYIEREILSAHI